MLEDIKDWIFINRLKSVIIAITTLLLIGLLTTGIIVFQKKQATETIKENTSHAVSGVEKGKTKNIEAVLKNAEKNKKLNAQKSDKKATQSVTKSSDSKTVASENRTNGKVSTIGTIDSITTNNKPVATTDTFGFKDDVYKTHQEVERASVNDIKNFMKKSDYDKIVNTYGTGSISIPSINIKLPIIEGTSNEHLWVGATTFYKDQTVKRGNYPLFSHNTGYNGMLFTDLGKVEVGDRVQVISYADGYKQTVNYKVTEKKQVNYKKVDVIADQGDRRLTLITCLTAEPTFERIVVTAKPI